LSAYHFEGLSDWISANPANRSETLAQFKKFLTFVARRGPANTSSCATDLVSRDPEELLSLLQNSWTTGSLSPGNDSPGPLLVRAFLQPYAEWARERLTPPSSVHTPLTCPVCRHRPGVAALRPLGDGGKRFLVCSFCGGEWQFRRILCAGCGEEDHRKLPVYLTDATFEYIRLECCDSCNQYLKAIDLTKNGLAEPVVDELAALPLDLWARERGYSKITANLIGL
jgi:formate dehydrogenase maturation protein FdhE